jgi:hypothetical protein
LVFGFLIFLNQEKYIGIGVVQFLILVQHWTTLTPINATMQMQDG